MASASEEPSSRGWQVGKSLPGCLQYLLDQQLACDFTFKVRFPGDPERSISAHKLILSARSPVFEAMFDQNCKGNQKNESVVLDVKYDAFVTTLRYIYTDQAEISESNVMHVLTASRMYELDELATKCTDFLEEQITVDNVCSIFSQSVHYQEEKLIEKCLDIISPQVEIAVKTDGFVGMSHDALCKLVEYDFLKFGAEMELFEGCLEWAKKALTNKGENPTGANIRNVLGDCLFQIRFPDFGDAAAFALKFGQTGVLTGDEMSTVFNVMLTEKQSREAARHHLHSLAQLGFNTNSRVLNYARIPMYGVNNTVAGPVREEFTFSVNKTIKFVGLTVFSTAAAVDELTVSISVTKCTDDLQLLKIEKNVISLGNYKPVRIDTQKFTIDPDVKLKVAVSLTPVKNGNTTFGYGRATGSSGCVDVVFSHSIISHAFHRLVRNRYEYFGLVQSVLFQKC